MAQVLVENTHERPYSGYYRIENKDGGVCVRKHTFAAAGVTRCDEDIWEALLKTGNGVNTINSMMEQGVLIKTGGDGLADDTRNVLSMREANYARFVGVYKESARMRGKGNEVLENFLDESGIPNLEMSRENIGQHFDGDMHKSFAARLKAEIRDNMHQKSIIIPGTVPQQPHAPLDQLGIKDQKSGDRFEGLLTELEAAIPNLTDMDVDKNGKPFTASLKKLGVEISKDDRDHLWKLHLERSEKSEETE